MKLAELWEQEDEWRNAVEEEEEDEGFGWERAGRMRRQGEEEDEVTNGSLPKVTKMSELHLGCKKRFGKNLFEVFILFVL